MKSEWERADDKFIQHFIKARPARVAVPAVDRHPIGSVRTRSLKLLVKSLAVETGDDGIMLA